ncbi:MAG: hypothetical protein R2792_12475 [Saprospiraceae bacterium]
MRKIEHISWFLILLVIGGCKPDPTLIEGKVVDFKTRAPLDSVRFQICSADTGGDCLPGTDSEVFSDANGHFQLSWPADAVPLVLGATAKGDYAPIPSFEFEPNNANSVVLEAMPLDGTLTLVIRDTSGTGSRVFTYLDNPLLRIALKNTYSLTVPETNPVQLGQGEKYVAYFNMPSETMVYVHWGINDPAFEFQDSIFLPLGDTNAFTIEY